MHSAPDVQASGKGSQQVGTGEFEYQFPAIRGIQAGREYYVTMFPLRLIPKVFLFDEEELPPELRAQRALNRARVPEMARYMVENPDSWVFSALTASVNADVRFDSVGTESAATRRIGTLNIPMSATFVINDGQHRRAAIQQALRENPSLGDETIAVVLFIDIGLSHSQQMFADLNRYAIRPDKSLGVLYDYRDSMAEITRQVVKASPLLSDLTDLENSNLAKRSRKLFTLSALHTANAALLKDIEPESIERQVQMASEFWKIVADQFPVWQQVYRGEATAGEVRTDFIHTYSLVLHALGQVGNILLRRSADPRQWRKYLKGLASLDWHRNANQWEGRATVGGRVNKSRPNVEATRDQILAAIGMPVPKRSAGQVPVEGES